MLPKLSMKFVWFFLFLIFALNSEKSSAAIYGYVPGGNDSTISILNLDDFTTQDNNILVERYPYGVAIAPSGDYLYVTNVISNSVSQIDIATSTLYQTHPVGVSPQGIAVSPDGIYVYVACKDGNLYVINTTTQDQPVPFYIGTSLFGIDITPDGEFIYLTDNDANLVYVVETESFTVIQSLEIGAYPTGVAVTPSGTYVVVVCTGENSIYLINTADYVVSDPITVGTSPLGVAVTTDSSYVYVTNMSDPTTEAVATVSKVSLYDYSVVSIPLANEGDIFDMPMGVAMYPFGGKVYIVNNGTNTVKSFSIDDDNTFLGEFNVGDGPVGFGKFIPSEVPLELTAELVGDTAITISWKDNSEAETGFIIERKKFSKGSYEQIAWVEANVTNYSDVGLAHYASYFYRVSAYNDYGSTIYSNEATAQTLLEEYTGASCFIATAAFGSILEPHVRLLREFRDRYLVISKPGRAFLDLYYEHSPPIAKFIAGNAVYRFLVRWSLLPLVALSWMALTIGLLPTMFVFSAMAGLAAFLFLWYKQVGVDLTRKQK